MYVFQSRANMTYIYEYLVKSICFLYGTDVSQSFFYPIYLNHTHLCCDVSVCLKKNVYVSCWARDVHLDRFYFTQISSPL